MDKDFFQAPAPDAETGDDAELIHPATLSLFLAMPDLLLATPHTTLRRIWQFIAFVGVPLGEEVFSTEPAWFDGFNSAKQVLGSNGTIIERYRQPNYISAVLV